ncbi:sulfite exporter TauE/SafE family protein [uncultured Actinomyces sp.]|jgi:hypothetical protein|uniref:sulfite exporter TauE/SafE family protein n=1 Tax=uncultured Actinomyces sp. TaxID=249061 RepID=UPI00325FB5DC
MILHALLIGALVGVVVGSLGAGGGIVSVPILVYVLGQDPHQATGLSLIIVGLTAAVSLATRARSGSVAWPEGTIFAFAGLAGTWAGAALTGFLTGFFGVGGGFAIVPALHLALRYPMKRASATSLLVMVITAAFGLASRTLSGTLTITAQAVAMVALFTGASMVGGFVGARLTARVSNRVLGLVFAALLIIVAASTLAATLA